MFIFIEYLLYLNYLNIKNIKNIGKCKFWSKEEQKRVGIDPLFILFN